jgi:amino acid transporter
VQVPLLLLQGAIVTILALVFVVSPNTSSAFALLQDMSVILYMGMYVFMFAAVIKLRRSQPDRERPIKIPAVQLVAVIGIIASVSAIVLGLTPPSGYGSTSALAYGLLVAAGVIILAIPPQFIYRFRRPSWDTDPESLEAEPNP